MERVMDCEMADHFYNWLDRTVDPIDQNGVEEGIYALLREHPDMVNTHSWPEMRNLTEKPAV